MNEPFSRASGRQALAPHSSAFRRRRWPVIVLALAIIAGGACVYRYAHARLAAIAYVQSIGGEIHAEHTNKWSLSWLRTTLWLQSIHWVDVEGSTPDLRRLYSLRELETVHLRKCAIGPDDLHPLDQFPKLEELILMDVTVEGAVPRQLRSCRQLRTLALESASMTDANLEGLEDLPIIELGLEGPISDAVVNRLSRLRLRILFLRNTRITDQSVRALGSQTGLWSLDLTGASITDASLADIARLHALEILRLDDTAVTDAGVKQLARLPLKCLFLRGTRVTDKGRRALQDLLPSTRIDYRAHTPE